MVNTIEKAIVMIMEETFSLEETEVLNDTFNEVPEELMQTVNKIAYIYFKKGFSQGIEFKKYLKI